MGDDSVTLLIFSSALRPVSPTRDAIRRLKQRRRMSPLADSMVRPVTYAAKP